LLGLRASAMEVRRIGVYRQCAEFIGQLKDKFKLKS